MCPPVPNAVRYIINPSGICKKFPELYRFKFAGLLLIVEVTKHLVFLEQFGGTFYSTFHSFSWVSSIRLHKFPSIFCVLHSSDITKITLYPLRLQPMPINSSISLVQLTGLNNSSYRQFGANTVSGWVRSNLSNILFSKSA
jgi:hypothetical protein